MRRKLTKPYYFSVHGETEEYYLKNLQRLINNNNKSTKKVKFIIKKLNPESFFKAISVENRSPIYKVEDIESSNLEDTKKVENILKEMDIYKNSTNKFIFCYSNFTFELFLILHKKKYYSKCNDKTHYLKPFNDAYNSSYLKFDDFKTKKNFDDFFQKNITLEDIKTAINNCKDLTQINESQSQKKIFLSFSYFVDAPSTNMHLLVERVLKDVGLI